MRILFITRKFPPAVGGMEQFSAGFAKQFEDETVVIALRSSQRNLVWWIPYMILRAVWLARMVDVIHIGDGVLAWPGKLVHWLTRKPIAITVHGLDLTYSNFGYQRYIWSGLRGYSAIVCVSAYTESIVQAHLADARTLVIHNGIELPEHVTNSTIISTTARAAQITKYLPNLDITHSKVLLTIGRLVKRKGVNWFIKEVMSHLPSNYHYVIAGSGPEREKIEHTIAALQLSDRVHLLGYVPDEDIPALYSVADAFLMPNISVSGDVEGFGMVALESAAAGVPVIASNLEGITDAVIDHSTGFLVESSNVKAWKQAIHDVVEQSALPEQQVIQAVRRQYAWPVIKQSYQHLFNSLN